MDTNTHEWLCRVKALKQISPIRRFSDAPLRLVLMLPAHLPRRSLREGSCSRSCSKISDPRNTPNDTKEETTELIIKDETYAIVFASEILASFVYFVGKWFEDVASRKTRSRGLATRLLETINY